MSESLAKQGPLLFLVAMLLVVKRKLESAKFMAVVSTSRLTSTPCSNTVDSVSWLTEIGSASWWINAKWLVLFKPEVYTPSAAISKLPWPVLLLVSSSISSPLLLTKQPACLVIYVTLRLSSIASAMFLTTAGRLPRDDGIDCSRILRTLGTLAPVTSPMAFRL